MKILNLKEMEVIEGGKMFGWEQTSPTVVNWNDPLCPGGGPSTSYQETHYFMWIAGETRTTIKCWEAIEE